MKSYSFYNTSTGIFTGSVFIGDKDSLAINTPKGTKPIEGHFDHLSQKFDLKSGQVVDYIPPAPPDTELETFSWDASKKRWQSKETKKAVAQQARAKRDALLSSCDWTQLPDVVLAESVKSNWTAYRQALRKLPEQKEFPSSIVWPTPPNS